MFQDISYFDDLKYCVDSKQRCKWIERTTESSYSSALERKKEIAEKRNAFSYTLVTTGGLAFERLRKRMDSLRLCVRSSNELEMHMRNELCYEEHGEARNISLKCRSSTKRRVPTVPCRNREITGDNETAGRV